jgi:predicted cupin superfamily sugar epimerase
MQDAAYWIKMLDLKPHPEGGYFKETYRSNEIISEKFLPPRFDGDRAFATCIYYLLNQTDFSAFHAINQDEVWHFYAGSSLTIHIIDQNGTYSHAKLGRDIENGESFQKVVTANSLFAAAVDDIKSYSLVGCTVAPGFDFKDIKMPARSKLVERYPQHKEIIEKFTGKRKRVTS